MLLRHIKNIKKIIAAMFLLCALAGLYIAEYGNVPGIRQPAYNNTPINQIKYDASAKADFYTYNNKIYYCTKDGMQLLSDDGNIVWSDTYTVSEPYMVNDGEITAVCEPRGRNIYVYNLKGRMYTIESKGSISFISVNTKGYLCSVSSFDEYYELNVYNNSGERVFFGNFQMEDGFPVASDISDDGKILAVSFVTIDEINLKTKVLFYYIGEKENEESDSDSMFASFVLDNSVGAMICFMKDGSVIVVSDSKISCIDFSDGYTERWSKELNNELSAIAFPEKKYVAIAFGKKFINAKNPEEENIVKWFGLTGKEEANFKSNKTVTGLYPYEKATIIAADRSFNAVKNNGSLIWSYNTIQDVKKILFIDEYQDILFVTQSEADVTIVENMANEEQNSSENETKNNNINETTEKQTEDTAKNDNQNNNQNTQNNKNKNNKNETKTALPSDNTVSPAAA